MKILIPVILFCLGFIIFVRYLEKSSLFYPEKEILQTPETIGLSYDDVYFKTQDNLTLHGWFVGAQGAKATILFLHGNAGNISDRLGKIQMFNRIGYNVFIIDYRGFGRSLGNPTEKGMYLDALGAYDYLKSKNLGVDIVGYGASLGGAAIIDLATKRDMAGLIIDSSFSNAVDMAKQIYPFIPSFMVSLKLNSDEKIKNITLSKLFIHSREDMTVPFALGKKLFEAAVEPKTFLEITGSHNDGHLNDEQKFVGSIDAFLKGLKS